MYESRLMKSFKALEVKSSSNKVASHSQHSQWVKKLAPFSKYRTRAKNCRHFQASVLQELAASGELAGHPSKR